MMTSQTSDSESKNETYFELFLFQEISSVIEVREEETQMSVIKKLEDNSVESSEKLLQVSLMETKELSTQNSTEVATITKDSKDNADATTSSSSSHPEKEQKDKNTKGLIDATDMSPYPFDPRKQPLSEEELKPQTPRKRSRKKSVPDCSKTERYWSRRCKNNNAAKESRINRRLKENQIVMRTAFLEQENTILSEENKKLKKENELLKQRMESLKNTE